MMKSFGQAFSKACAVEGAEPSSPPSDGEIPFSAFLFDNFFFAPLASKKKWLTNLYDLTNSLFMMRFVSSLEPLSMRVVYFFHVLWKFLREGGEGEELVSRVPPPSRSYPQESCSSTGASSSAESASSSSVGSTCATTVKLTSF